ncbi:hypothetical protein BGW36DRAFT_425000 [Talaromyces proteolyticus]|uniref:Uncharacterized protein n=1 Tax=Talaromyces proteolyticus TaxID=1131652 RepID=A0AAD4KUB9_9EURO|nr:uncharacterized protein BGW36DRAFT_425000 [Talaromyces proteolyticus]KAH8700165.1 hypothetical protein BGW36DRAFT_425000 [Talaromyces proteolyticus]
MGIPGVLMRLSEGTSSTVLPLPGIAAIYTLRADDNEKPIANTVYFLNDISPLLSSRDQYDADSDKHSDVSWIICSFINGRDAPGDEEPQIEPHKLPVPAAQGSVLVVNGSTPQSDKEADYHAWYDQEHGGKLTRVPGWTAARRYALVKSYGPSQTASFYGFNFYKEENGLGGPEWQAGVTDWTLRIRSNAAKPNIRRVWEIVATQ